MNRFRSALAFVVLCAALAGTSAEAAKVNARLRFDPRMPSGADAEGRVLLFTPKPVQDGSSHSHFEPSVFPNALMEPAINSDLAFAEVDLTRAAMHDFGWPAGGLDFQINYSDSASTGFNDPVLGSQRKTALEAAVGVWSAILGSSVTVNIDASFDDLTCDDDGATLARAGPRFAFRDFTGGTPGVWHSGALAEALAGQNLSLENNSNPDAADLGLTFNLGIDQACLGADAGYYYGLDGDAPPGQISFVAVALHEIGHGLGFVGFVDLASGALFRGRPDVFTTLTFDTKKKLHWDEMTDAQRAKSAVRPGEVSLDGPEITKAAETFLGGSFVVQVKKPKSLRGRYLAGPANFGPLLDEAGLRRNLALVDDGSDKPTFACQPIVNASAVAGKIAVIDRGDCLFVEKVKHAQEAGAVAAIIVHNEPGPPPGLGGSDPSITIPSVRVTKKDGKKIKRRLRK